MAPAVRVAAVVADSAAPAAVVVDSADLAVVAAADPAVVDRAVAVADPADRMGVVDGLLGAQQHLATAAIAGAMAIMAARLIPCAILLSTLKPTPLADKTFQKPPIHRAASACN